MLKEQLSLALSKPGERPAMRFLAKHPEIVNWGYARTAGHANYVLKEFPFGSRYRADFVVLYAYSGVWEVHFVELEPPNDKIITKKGLPSAHFNAAISQLNDWRDYILLNRASVQRDLSDWCQKKDLLGWISSEFEPSNYTSDRLSDPSIYIDWQFHIVIGRRAIATGDVRRKMNQIRGLGYVKVGTYDRFLDIASNYDRHHANPDESIWLNETRDESY